MFTVVVAFMPFVYLCFFAVLSLVRVAFFSRSAPVTLRRFIYTLYTALSIVFISGLLGVLFILVMIIEFIPLIHVCFLVCCR